MQYLLGKAADPDVVNREGETPDRVSGAGPEAFELLQEARRRKRGSWDREREMELLSRPAVSKLSRLFAITPNVLKVRNARQPGCRDVSRWPVPSCTRSGSVRDRSG